MKRKTVLILLSLIQLAAAFSYAEGFDFLTSKKYGYQIRLSRPASYQLAPGDYLEMYVVSGPPESRTRHTVVKRAQAVQIVDLNTGAVQVTLALNKRQLLAIQEALSQADSRIALRIVEKQRRPDLYAAENDPLPDLDFERSTDLAQQAEPAN